jgi:hypothetical protein
MISLDVKNVNTSISKHETINVFKKKLIRSNKFNASKIQKIIQSINIIINQNYFQYNYKLYS